jgi:hypothetical protein
MELGGRAPELTRLIPKLIGRAPELFARLRELIVCPAELTRAFPMLIARPIFNLPGVNWLTEMFAMTILPVSALCRRGRRARAEAANRLGLLDLHRGREKTCSISDRDVNRNAGARPLDERLHWVHGRSSRATSVKSSGNSPLLGSRANPFNNSRSCSPREPDAVCTRCSQPT